MRLKYSLILASHSPRRQHLLREMGIDFTIRTVPVDEDFPADLPIDHIAGYLARKKADAFEGIRSSEMILTADTIVAHSGKILGKPADEKEAFSMLMELSGLSHKVYTGVCLRIHDQFHLTSDCTEVIFRNLTKNEINYYIQHYMPLDKAGAYGIQEWIGMIGIEKINGSYFNVVGLPVMKVYELMKALDLVIL